MNRFIIAIQGLYRVQGKYMRTVLDLLQCTMSISYHVQIVYIQDYESVADTRFCQEKVSFQLTAYI